MPGVLLRVLFVGVLVSASGSAAPFSSETRPGATPVLAARSAISPSLVAGEYAPPANLYPHRPQSHIPTDSRLTDVRWHCGHSWEALSPVKTVEYRFLATVPYRGPKLPEGPTLYVLPTVDHWFTFERIVSRKPFDFVMAVVTICLTSSGVRKPRPPFCIAQI